MVQNTHQVAFKLVTTALIKIFIYALIQGIDCAEIVPNTCLIDCHKTVILPYETLLCQSYMLYMVSDFVRFLVWHSIAGIPEFVID